MYGVGGWEGGGGARPRPPPQDQGPQAPAPAPVVGPIGLGVVVTSWSGPWLAAAQPGCVRIACCRPAFWRQNRHVDYILSAPRRSHLDLHRRHNHERHTSHADYLTARRLSGTAGNSPRAHTVHMSTRGMLHTGHAVEEGGGGETHEESNYDRRWGHANTRCLVRQIASLTRSSHAACTAVRLASQARRS